MLKAQSSKPNASFLRRDVISPVKIKFAFRSFEIYQLLRKVLRRMKRLALGVRL